MKKKGHGKQLIENLSQLIRRLKLTRNEGKTGKRNSLPLVMKKEKQSIKKEKKRGKKNLTL